MARTMTMAAALLTFGATFAGAQGGQPKKQPGPPGQKTQQQGGEVQRIQQQSQIRIQQQTQARIQERVQQLDEMSRDMARIRNQAQAGSRQMQQHMEQNQANVTNRERMLKDNYDALAATADQLTTLADRTRDMQRDRDMQHDMVGDRDMDRDMDRLHDHLRTLSTDLDSTLRDMDRLRTRIHQTTP